MEKNKIVSIVVVVVLLVVAGFFALRGDKSVDSTENSTENVATVNGVSINKGVYDTQLAQLLASQKAAGVDVDNAENLAQIKSKVLEDLINNELVEQGIASAGIKASAEDVEKQVQEIIKQAGGADQFKAELTKASLTEEKLRENISKQLAIQMYLSSNINTAAITVSDDEVSKFYTEYSQAQKTASSTIVVPPQKELADPIKQQIISNKQQVLINDFLASLRSKAQIVKLI